MRTKCVNMVRLFVSLNFDGLEWLNVLTMAFPGYMYLLFHFSPILCKNTQIHAPAHGSVVVLDNLEGQRKECPSTA